MPQITDRTGRAAEFTPSMEMYANAFDKGMSLPAYLNATIDTDAEKHGTPFEQLLASSGMYLKEDRANGIRPPTLHSVLNGSTELNMAITRPDGSQALTVPGRYLFPAVILELVESQLLDDTTAYEAVFNQMVAYSRTVDSPRVEQPLINLSAPRSSASAPIAQMAEPNSMVSISLSSRSYRLPTFSIGLEISDEAAKASAIDLVGIALREQALGERAAIVDAAIAALVNGDTDMGLTALSSENAVTYDSTVTAGVMTNKAWVKWLRKDWKKLNINWVMTDLDTFLAIEGRTGRPTLQTDAGNDSRLTSLPINANSGVPDSVNFFTLDSNTILGANTLVGLDSSKAIQRIVYAGASYSAIESYIMRRSSALRIDWSLAYSRLFDQGFKKLVVT